MERSLNSSLNYATSLKEGIEVNEDHDVDDDDDDDDPLDFEEWDGKTPFWHHCLAGSMAGVAEHILVYPLDTVKTHIQCAACPAAAANFPGNHPTPAVGPSPSMFPSASTLASGPTSASTSASTSQRSICAKGGVLSPQSHSLAPTQQGMTLFMKPTATVSPTNVNNGILTTMRHIVSQPILATPSSIDASVSAAATLTDTTAVGMARLWRGVQTVLVGCIPAHALYFSNYEAIKYYFTDPIDGTLPYWAGHLAGAAAVLGHDLIMTPLDTIKQRLQLGHYAGLRDAAFNIMQQEGTFALYRSLPVTLFTNIPYGCIMVSTNEWCKAYLSPQHPQSGLSHSTTPQSPSLGVYLLSSGIGGFLASFITTPLDRVKTMLQVQQLQPAYYCERYLEGSCPKISTLPKEEPSLPPRLDANRAIRTILQREGFQGLFRGCLPRVLSHTPAVAISWTTYETAKQWLNKW